MSSSFRRESYDFISDRRFGARKVSASNHMAPMAVVLRKNSTHGLIICSLILIFLFRHLSNTFSWVLSFDHFVPRPMLKSIIARRKTRRAIAHLLLRSYRARLTATKGFMMEAATGFTKSIVIKPPNKRLVAFSGQLLKYMRRKSAFRGNEDRLPIFWPTHYCLIFWIIKDSFIY